MRQFSAFEAKNKFGTLLDLVEQGEEVVVTRHGKPVARLVAETAVRPKSTPEEIARIKEEFRQLAKGMKLDGVSIKELIEEGRR
jgi:prevent-host-death family protein